MMPEFTSDRPCSVLLFLSTVLFVTLSLLLLAGCDDGWDRIESETGGYQADWPGKVIRNTEQIDWQEEKLLVPYDLYSDENTLLLVTWTDLAEADSREKQSLQRETELEKVRLMLALVGADPEGVKAEPEEGKAGDEPGQTYSGVVQRGERTFEAVVRIVTTGQRQYFVVAMHDDYEAAAEKASRFLDSFRLIKTP